MSDLFSRVELTEIASHSDVSCDTIKVDLCRAKHKFSQGLRVISPTSVFISTITFSDHEYFCETTFFHFETFVSDLVKQCIISLSFFSNLKFKC